MPRSFRSYIASASTGLLQVLNILVFSAAAATIVLELLVEHNPSRVGWCFLIVGIVTAVSGIFGYMASKSTGCFSWHLIALMFSLVGLFAASLVVLIKTSMVLEKLHYKNSLSSARNLIKLMASIMFITGCGQVVILMLAIIASCCEFVGFYEDLEMSNRPRGSGLSGISDESGKRTAKKKETKASKLAEKMKQKYGRWTREGEFGR